MLSYSWVIALVGSVAFVVYRLYSSFKEDKALQHIPTHEFEDGDNSRSRYMTDLKQLLETGYRKYNKQGQAFKVRVPIGGYSVKYRIILPKEHLEEIKHLSNSVFSWQLASRVIFAQDYTGAPDRGAWSGKALRVGIHQNLAEITERLDHKISEYFKAHLPQNRGQTASIRFMQFLVPAIGNVTNGLLVDERLSSDPLWVKETCEMAVNRYKSADDVRAWPPHLAALVSPMLESVKELRRSRAYVKMQMTPLFNDLRAREALDPGEKKRAQKGHYGFDWLWGGAPDSLTLDDFSDTMMRTLIASIHTTAKTISVALIDLLSQPTYFHELLEEAKLAIRPDGSVYLDKLPMTDCFLKESQRLTPMFLLTMNRIVTSDYAFKSSGLEVPAKSMTTAASAAIATDPDTFSDPNTFDGHRYWRLRQQDKGTASSLAMGMATTDSLGFGLGNQACPGRFFAVNEMKVVLARLLTGWNLTLEKNGVEYTGGRPEIGYNDFSLIAPVEWGVRLTKK
ncbi:hypothetical protein LTR96_011057 [Exophiala xenobiotica]|nr:hypothetical protein LTR41_011181 [Exophiala xenobiotica]KAK5215816.1 hypothetical protein LTR72_011172 [Exophiala xenobiotica]KAK5220851.1 hypothetical protein LTR47_011110 [Exophiala xenobiotica]KAK5245661.1 hypothetical protein LTS06_008962 [Exophiala xenobiotica]KAK5263525.1 hypothetical protein LTR96_011057 [Exophiala xenobiotica]